MKAKRHKTMPLVKAFYYSVSIIRILTNLSRKRRATVSRTKRSIQMHSDNTAAIRAQF